MIYQKFESDFKESENYKDLTNLLKNNYQFVQYKYHFYNTEHDSTKLEIGLKIIFAYINKFYKNYTHDLIINKFDIVKKIIKECCTEPNDNTKLAEELCSAINSIINAYSSYTRPNRELTIEDYLDYEFRITSIQYKISHINEIISYGLWREEYNYGKLYHSNVNRLTPYSYSTFMKVFLSKKFLRLRNEIKILAYKLIESANIDGVGDVTISNQLLKQLEIFINKQYMYLNDTINVFDELRTYIENVFISILGKNSNNKNYNVETLDDVAEIKVIMKAISFWEDNKEDIINKNIKTRITTLKDIKVEEMEDKENESE